MSAEGVSERIASHLKEYGLSAVTAYLLAAFIAILLFKQVSKRKYRLPPGPIGLPFLGYAPFLGREPHIVFYKLSKKYGNLIREEIEEHKRTFREDNIRDLVDAFLLEMKKRQDGESSFNDDFLLGNALIFFNAGGDTTKATLCWLFLLMATHQDIQQKAYQEIIEVIGKERIPSWSDHTKLPYSKSAIAESQRIKPTVPLNFERGPSGDSTIYGYDIPKHVILFTNIWAVHHDPTYWKNPEKFDPARFLSEDGNKYIRSERLIPFSAGRRSCPGETMANVEIFLYFVSILQHFQFSVEEGQKIDVDEIMHAFVPFALMDRIEFKLRNE